jgi:hypothetical protein
MGTIFEPNLGSSYFKNITVPNLRHAMRQRKRVEKRTLQYAAEETDEAENENVAENRSVKSESSGGGTKEACNKKYKDERV